MDKQRSRDLDLFLRDHDGHFELSVETATALQDDFNLSILTALGSHTALLQAMQDRRP